MDPFSLIAAGVGTVGSLIGGIKNAAEMPGKKRKWKEEQKRRAKFEMNRNFAADMGMPTYDADARENNRRIDDQADEQFQVDPMSFVPFVQNGSKLASGIYNAASEPDTLVSRMPVDDVERQNRAMLGNEDELERAKALQHFQSMYGPGYQGYSR
jgi:hypothetical protein